MITLGHEGRELLQIVLVNEEILDWPEAGIKVCHWADSHRPEFSVIGRDPSVPPLLQSEGQVGKHVVLPSDTNGFHFLLGFHVTKTSGAPPERDGFAEKLG